MCKFFSFCGDGFGNYKFYRAEERKAMFGEGDSPDSHTHILEGVPVELQDRWSRYEYNPLTKEFTVDQGVEGHNHERAKNWVTSIDWSLVVPELVVKSIVNPFTDRNPPKKITKEHIGLVRKWASVWAYVSSFFTIVYEHDFSSINALWEQGLVPSFDGKVWRLHGGKDAKVLWEGTF